MQTVMDMPHTHLVNDECGDATKCCQSLRKSKISLAKSWFLVDPSYALDLAGWSVHDDVGQEGLLHA